MSCSSAGSSAWMRIIAVKAWRTSWWRIAWKPRRTPVSRFFLTRLTCLCMWGWSLFDNAEVFRKYRGWTFALIDFIDVIKKKEEEAKKKNAERQREGGGRGERFLVYFYFVNLRLTRRRNRWGVITRICMCICTAHSPFVSACPSINMHGVIFVYRSDHWSQCTSVTFPHKGTRVARCPFLHDNGTDRDEQFSDAFRLRKPKRLENISKQYQ